MTELSSKTPDVRSLILLWAFAESGIGGLLHALKLPFTGIMVGGIAVVCIALIGYYIQDKKNVILQALALVLTVKLALSPHSPWQAYVAVIFQGYVGHLLFRNGNHFKAKAFFFAIICLLESALQKLILSVLIFGLGFLKSVDAAAQSILKSLGVDVEGSFVFVVFGIYVALHLGMGILLGLWIPKIPSQIAEAKFNILSFESFDRKAVMYKSSRFRTFLIGILIYIGILLCIKWWVPEIKALDLLWFFTRTVLISFGMIYIVGPLITRFIVKKYMGKSESTKIVDEIIRKIPDFTNRAFNLVSFVHQNYTGWQKIKYFVLGLLVLSMETNHLDD